MKAPSPAAAASPPHVMSLEVPWGLRRLLDLHARGATGVLRFEEAGRTEVRVYLMDGQVIGAATPVDGWLLGRLLLNNRAVDPGGLEHLVFTGAPPELLAERLLQADLVVPDIVQHLQEERFRDNVFACTAFTEGQARFEAEDAVFPPEIHLDLDLDSFVQEAAEWYHRVRPWLVALDIGLDPVFRLVPRDRVGRPRPGSNLVPLLESGPESLTSLLARSPHTVARTLEALAELTDDERVVQEVPGEPPVHPGDDADDLEEEETHPPGGPEADPPSSGDRDLDVRVEVDAAAAAEMSEDGDSGDWGPPPMQSGSFAPMDAPEPGLPLGTGAGAPPTEVEAGARAVHVEDLAVDYDRVNSGHFVHSYDVKDVVDLTGIEAIPVVGGSVEEIVALGHAAEDEEVALGHGDEVVALGADVPEPVDVGTYEIERVFAELDEAPPDRRLEEVLSLPIAGRAPSEDPTEEYSILVDEDGAGRGKPRGTSPPANGAAPKRDAAHRFEARQVEEFHQRIEIFNRIFQIIFRTFASQIGPERTTERFNRFLSDETLQYPGLFRRLQTLPDGRLDPRELVQNLAEAHPGDPAAFLHQGLYELIYVHLYDARDLLPPDLERDMMDQIDAFEQRLHAR